MDEELTVGQVARRLDVPVRTVRFWSDEGLAGRWRARRRATGRTTPPPWRGSTWSARCASSASACPPCASCSRSAAPSRRSPRSTCGRSTPSCASCGCGAPCWLQTLGRQALADGTSPGSAGAQALLAELLDDASPARRSALADRLATFTDERVERYWALLGVLNGWPPFEPATPAVAWWVTALRAAPAR